VSVRMTPRFITTRLHESSWHVQVTSEGDPWELLPGIVIVVR